VAVKELLFFEWVIFDNCNLQCPYCVNKGEFSHKESGKMSYVPGREVDIAYKIVELSHLAKKVVVNLTGGEPLLASHIKEVILILKTAHNIRINLISNFSLVDKIAENLTELDSILVSLHIKHRSKTDIEHITNSINYAKLKAPLSLSQVDYNLNEDDKRALLKISLETGLKIGFQPFISRWTEKGKTGKSQKINDKTFVSSLGKRCSLGYFSFLLLPDGTFYHGLWCNKNSQKMGNFLAPLAENQQAFFPVEMGKCQASSCSCNYNTFYYDEYKAECRKLGYPQEGIFGRHNIRIYYVLSHQISRIPNILFRQIKRIIFELKK